jgi:prepilin-type N-terminal cleavage/methylation domain-containing protein
MRMNVISRNKFGFTLIELMVTISILAFISTIILADFREGDRQKRVFLAADSVTNFFRQAQNYTLTGKQISSNFAAESGVRCINNNSPAYYRTDLSVNSSTIILRGEDTCGAVFKIEDHKFAPNTKVKEHRGIELSRGGVISHPSFAIVRFSPPFGKMTVSTNNGGDYTEFTYLDVVVNYEGTQRARTVRIDGVSGRIGE